MKKRLHKSWLIAGVLGIALGAIPVGVPVAADNNWIGADGAWENPANWLLGVLPGTEDFVELPGGVTISSTGNNNTAEELLSHAVVNVSSGLLDVIGTYDTFADLNITTGARLELGRLFVQASAIFDVRNAGTEVELEEGVFSSGMVRLTDHANLNAESFDNFNQWLVDANASASANSMINHAGALLRVESGGQKTINGNLTNEGEVKVNNASADIQSIDNFGTLALNNQGTLSADSIDSSGFITVSDTHSLLDVLIVTLDAGQLDVTNGGTAAIDNLNNGAVVKVNAASFSGGDVLNRASGEVTLENAASSQTTGSFINHGKLVIRDGANLGSSRFQQIAGTTHLDDGELAATHPLGVDIAGGTLFGSGVINGDLFIGDGATLSPGDLTDAIGRFDITGDATLEGLFEVEIGGINNTEFDWLSILGTATLDGVLKVSLVNGFTPSAGDFFDLLLATQVTGQFAVLDLPSLADGLAFESIYGEDFFRLAVVSAVPLPPSVILFLGGLGFLVLRARRSTSS